MSDNTVINIIQPPANPVKVTIQELDNVKINVLPIENNVSISVQEALETEVNISQIGQKGDKGDAGGQYKHEQSIAASEWNISHGMGFKPGGIVVKDSAGSLWIPGEINYIDNNNIILKFINSSFAGTAYLS